MDKLATVEWRDGKAERRHIDGGTPEAGLMMARARWLMIISAVTTLVAIAAVIGVIGYRVFRAGGSGAAAATAGNGTIVLPKGARVVATTVSGDRIVVTLETAGATEIRIFDIKTLSETGRIRFATQP